MTLDRRDVVAALESKGFSRADNRDHDVFLFRFAGLTRAVFTKVSRGTSHKTIGKPLINVMSRQLQLTKRDFLALVECSLSAEGYLDHLRRMGIIPSPEPTKEPPDPDSPKKSDG